MHKDTQMKFTVSRYSLHFLAFAMLATLLASCGGLGGEPEIIATMPPPTQAPTQPTSAPAAAVPDHVILAQGAAIFAQNCTACHGVSGAGDGELAQAGSIPNPRDFTDYAAVASKTPQDYYQIITDGNLDNLMPPWGNALTDEERWAVAMFTYTLRYTPVQLALGQEIYLRVCAECHGEAGEGDGPEAILSERNPGNLTDLETMATLSDDHIYTLVTEGIGDEMPAYQDELTEEERIAVVTFTRTFTTTTASLTDHPESIAQAAAESSGTITGEIINGTTDGDVPPGLPVTLHIFDTDFREEILETTIDDDGSFIFEDVAINGEKLYFASTVYQERYFASPPTPGNPSAPDMDFPVIIYELTDDPANINILGLVTQINPAGELLEVLHVVRFENTSDRLFSTDHEIRDERFASVSVALPPGALVLGLEGETRFVIDQETFTVTDTRALLPGAEHFVRVSYLLPYSSEAIIEYPVDYNLNGPVRLLVGTQALSVISEQFEPLGVETIHDTEYMAYGGNLSLQSGDLIRYELRGRAPGIGTSQDSSVVTADNLLPVLAVAAVLIALFTGGILALSRRHPEGADTIRQQSLLIDGLVRQIAELDEQHERGEINHDLYHHRRSQLKARLAELMDSAE
jgi:mono/diheme cytochrome c family protein